jgi:mRNA-degrading endonuclease toxin of MazEF toxin-antitoxin module
MLRLLREPINRTRRSFLGKSGSEVLTEQIRALDQQRLVNKIGTVSQQFLRLIEKAMLNSLDM